MSRYPSADGTGQKRALMAPGAVETMGDIVRDFRNETLGTGCWMQLQAKEGVNKSVEKWVKGADGREDRRMIRRNIITVFYQYICVYTEPQRGLILSNSAPHTITPSQCFYVLPAT
jgi:hypothetical protein